MIVNIVVDQGCRMDKFNCRRNGDRSFQVLAPCRQIRVEQYPRAHPLAARRDDVSAGLLKYRYLAVYDV